MEKELLSFHKSPEIVARLLSIGDDIEQLEEYRNEERGKAELLRDWMAGTLPPDAVVVDLLPAFQKHVYLEEWHDQSRYYNLAFLDGSVDFIKIHKGLYVTSEYRILPFEELDNEAYKVQQDMTSLSNK